MTAFTTEEELRLQDVEDSLDIIFRKLNNVISTEQFNRLRVIKQREYELLIARIDTLVTDVAALQEEVSSMS